MMCRGLIPGALVAMLVLGAGACATVPDPAVTASPTPDEPAPPPATGSVIPRGTDIQLALTDSLSARGSRTGDLFTATVTTPIVALNGEVALAAGTEVTGIITGVDPSSAAGDPAAIRLNLLRIRGAAGTHPFNAEILAVAAPATVVTGDDLDAAIAGPLGRGAGTVVSLGSGNRPAVLDRGTTFTVRTREFLQFR